MVGSTIHVLHISIPAEIFYTIHSGISTGFHQKLGLQDLLKIYTSVHRFWKLYIVDV